jgi:prepilin-type N-terminal cleavage/methylation domain-containing protein
VRLDRAREAAVKPGGFSLVELLIASTVSALLVGALVTVLAPTRAAFDATPATLELQQRSRMGLEFLASALRSAGAHEAGHRQSSLAASFIPALIPAIASGVADDFSEIEIFRQVASGAHGVLEEDQSTAGATLTLAPGRECLRTPDVCGFVVGTIAAISDGQGRFDVFEVAATDPARMTVMPLKPLSAAYARDAQLFEAETFRFSLAMQPDGSKSLVRVPGSGTAQPVVDGVTELDISLWGEAGAPQITWDGTDGWASYGPEPPAAAFRDGGNGWPAGESCVAYRDPLGPHSRLTDLGQTGTLVLLARRDLTDGPWCAGGALGAYDADLIRLRRVDISIRLESLIPALRGPAGQLFSRPGSSRSPLRWVPDRVVNASISLRNQR